MTLSPCISWPLSGRLSELCSWACSQPSAQCLSTLVHVPFLGNLWAGPVSDSPGSRGSVITEDCFPGDSCFPRLDSALSISLICLSLPRSSCRPSRVRHGSPCAQGCCCLLPSLGTPMSSRKRMMHAFWAGEWVVIWC